MKNYNTLILIGLLTLFIVSLTGCSGAEVKNSYTKSGPRRTYSGSEPYKKQSIKIIVPKNKNRINERSNATIIINDNQIQQNEVIKPKNEKKKEKQVILIEKVGNDKYIIRVK
jgi:hypothetical protein